MAAIPVWVDGLKKGQPLTAQELADEIEEFAREVYALTESIEHEWEDLPVGDGGETSDHERNGDDWEIDERCLKCKLLMLWSKHDSGGDI